jgi:hypothetical protein
VYRHHRTIRDRLLTIGHVESQPPDVAESRVWPTLATHAQAVRSSDLDAAFDAAFDAAIESANGAPAVNRANHDFRAV